MTPLVSYILVTYPKREAITRSPKSAYIDPIFLTDLFVDDRNKEKDSNCNPLIYLYGCLNVILDIPIEHKNVLKYFCGH